NVLKSLVHPPPELITSHFPKTVKEAVDKLLSVMPVKEKSALANMKEDELVFLPSALGGYIRNKFGLWSGNEALQQSCRYMLKRYDICEDEALSLIIKELWSRLRKTHGLRVVK
ncbi:MAG: DUF6794 domain-containing protein, partial [Pseudomonadota bacterium]